MLISVGYDKAFVRDYKKLNPSLQKVVKEVIEEFKKPENHLKLKVHKLHGKLEGQYSFSVDYKNRIVFEYLNNDVSSVSLLSVGSHDIYK